MNMAWSDIGTYVMAIPRCAVMLVPVLAASCDDHQHGDGCGGTMLEDGRTATLSTGHGINMESYFELCQELYGAFKAGTLEVDPVLVRQAGG